MSLRSQFLARAESMFPALSPTEWGPLISENLLCDAILELPASVLTQVREFVAAAFELRSRPAYQAYLASEKSRRQLRDPGNFGIAMSYDFHLDESGRARLIEVNTNASFLALGDLLYETRGLARPIANFTFDEIRNCLLRELELSGLSTPSPRVLIIDENPTEQKLYAEFLLYREWMRRWGWSCEIVDSRTALANVDLIYNRDTDFYLESSERKSLRDAWLEKKICLTPHPYEYLCLADKDRLVDWNRPQFLEQMGLTTPASEALRRGLPLALDLTTENAEELWAQRKSLFFKPKRSFGAKQSFRGASISRRAFDELAGQDILAQEFVPAPEIEIPTPEGPQKMKYDLRFYAYADRVQSVVARVYQGQVTNLRTPYGGFAAVRFV